MPTLYLIPCTIAPETAEAVLSPQIREVIIETNHFFAENLRTARRFIGSLHTGKNIGDILFYELNKDTPPADTFRVIKELYKKNINIGVLSEAGCPGIADPGSVAVDMAHATGFVVKPLVGPSSILLALMASGFSGQSFAFVGYLPIDKAARQAAIRKLEKTALTQSQIFIETPYRNNHLFADLLATCQPNTRLCVACQLTGADEYIRTQNIANWLKTKPLPDLHKKPTIFILG